MSSVVKSQMACLHVGEVQGQDQLSSRPSWSNQVVELFDAVRNNDLTFAQSHRYMVDPSDYD